MNTLILYPLLTTCLYYLGSRAKITAFLWKQYPKGFDEFMLCAACAGLWYGILVGIWGAAQDLPFLGMTGKYWFTPILVGACSSVWTPILSRIHIAGIEHTSGVDDGDDGRDK